MNIGILDEYREKNLTGVNRVVAGTLEELLKIDKENTYKFLGKTDYLPVKLDEVGIFFDKSKEVNLNYTLWSHDFDIVHSYFRAYDFNEHIKCARVLTIHDLILLAHPEMGTKDLYEYYAGPLKNCAQKSDCIIADSEFTKKEIVQYYDIQPEKIKVVYPGLYPKNKFSASNVEGALAKLQNQPYILSVSGLTIYKNHIGLMNAFRIFKERHPESDLKLVITGPARINMQGIQEALIRIPNYETEVIFTGYVTDEELIWLYRNCLAYALVSWFEGFGLTILEAQSQGKAVITSNTTSMPEVGGDAAEYVDPFNVESIVTAMENVVLNDMHRKELEEKAIIQAKKFSYEKAARDVLDIYNSFQ